MEIAYIVIKLSIIIWLKFCLCHDNASIATKCRMQHFAAMTSLQYKSMKNNVPFNLNCQWQIGSEMCLWIKKGPAQLAYYSPCQFVQVTLSWIRAWDKVNYRGQLTAHVNGLSPAQSQAWVNTINTESLSIGPPGKKDKFHWCLKQNTKITFDKMSLKTTSAKKSPFCSSPSVTLLNIPSKLLIYIKYKRCWIWYSSDYNWNIANIWNPLGVHCEYIHIL